MHLVLHVAGEEREAPLTVEGRLRREADEALRPVAQEPLEVPEGEDAEAEESAPPDSLGDDKKYAAPAFGVKAQGGRDSVLGTEEDEDGPGT